MLPLVAALALSGEQQFMPIGDLTLQSGQILKDCTVGYRTYGTLDAAKDNAILFPTWYLGKSGDLAGNFGPNGLVDPARYYIIAVDALGDAVSTSPSNSKTQHDGLFPRITIRDMVESQHAMLLKMGISHLKAVMGISMGGIQTFQWITAYPDFMDCAVPIVGSPRATSYDLMLYGSSLQTVKAAIADKTARSDLIKAFADTFYLALNTPTYYVLHVSREHTANMFQGFEKAMLSWDPYDIAEDMDALLNNDDFSPFGEDEGKAAAAVHAKVLVVSASQDHCVNPATALSFAKALNAPALVLDDDSGHSAPGGETPKIREAISKLLGG
jgi:homoserine O-acetyltransferase